MQNLKQKFNSLKQHKHFKELMSHAMNLSYKDVLYSQKLVSSRDINHHNCGAGYVTDVTSASYEDNYNYELTITKKDYKAITSKRYTLELYNKLKSDLEYYIELNVETIYKKYLLCDLNLLYKFGLVEIIGDFYLVSNLENSDILTINKSDIITNDILYVLINSIKLNSFKVAIYRTLETVLYTFIALFSTILVIFMRLFELFFIVLSRYKNSS